jgi:signal peptidase I
MEPTLKDGDVLLVRKSDILADYNLTTTEQNETDRARLKRMEATMSGTMDHPIMSRPPLVLSGHAVVFYSPKKAFPHEYHVKRVAGVGGQLVSRFEV